MLKELRMSKLKLSKAVNYDDYQSFSIGSDTCIIKFFKLTEDQELLDFLRARKAEGKQIKIVTPFVPEKHLDKMKKVLKNMLQSDLFKDSVVVVNDLGMMQYIHSISKTTGVCIGRILLYSVDTVPWGELISRSETEEVQKIVHQISLYDNIKMEFYKEFNVTEIEVNLTEGCVESLKAIQKNGFKVNVHHRDILYGTQRSCPIRRNGNFDCAGSECEQFEELHFYQLWSPTGPYAPSDNIPFPESIYVEGNRIAGTLKEIDESWSDDVIYDLARIEFFKGDEIA